MHAVSACPVFFEIGLAQEKALARQIVELKQVVLPIGKSRVERVDEPGDPIPLPDHDIADVEIAVDEAGFLDLFGKDDAELLPRRPHGEDDLCLQFSLSES